jgi:hypothetical protein
MRDPALASFIAAARPGDARHLQDRPSNSGGATPLDPADFRGTPRDMAHPTLACFGGICKWHAKVACAVPSDTQKACQGGMRHVLCRAQFIVRELSDIT